MTIDWLNFTPLTSLIGGVLIGVAASLLFMNSGRILGVTGILEGLLRSRVGDKAWRLSFVLGLLASGLIAQWSWPADWMHAPRIDASWSLLILAGLLVGLGTRWGAGCTSGHSICGLSRFSLRSLIATLSFMATGFLTVFLIRHIF